MPQNGTEDTDHFTSFYGGDEDNFMTGSLALCEGNNSDESSGFRASSTTPKTQGVSCCRDTRSALLPFKVPCLAFQYNYAPKARDSVIPADRRENKDDVV